MKKVIILTTIFLSYSGYSLGEKISSDAVPVHFRCSDYREAFLGEWLEPSICREDEDLEEVVDGYIDLNTDLFEIENFRTNWRYIHKVKISEVVSKYKEKNCTKLLVQKNGFVCVRPMHLPPLF